MTSKSERRGEPAAAGLAAFGVTATLLSLVNAGLLPDSGESVVLPMALAFGGLIQVLAGILEYREKNTFGTTVFLSYGAFWLWFGLMVIWGRTGLLNLNGTDSTVGAALLLWALLTVGFLIASLRLSRYLVVTVFMALITLILLGFWKILGSFGLRALGGWAGVITGLLAMYGSAAILINAESGRTVLPLGAISILASDAMLVDAKRT